MNDNKKAVKFFKDLKKIINTILPELEKQVPVKVAHIIRFYDKETEKNSRN